MASHRCTWRLIGTLAGLAVLSPAASAAGKVDFAAQIRPIFVAHCIKCHGPKEAQSGLRLDTYADLKKGGDRGPTINAGHADKSILYQALLGQNDITAMPAEAARLPAASIALVKKWIDEGAPGPADQEDGATAVASNHWSFRPISRPATPHVAGVGNAIDAFIRARLEREKLAPSPEADRATLIRRLSLDLRGLPPSPEEVAEYRADEKPGAYERLVDRMFASPAYGERWGRHWLDQARYADSNGFTIDGPRSIWKYREWVIRAINDDMPFDQFSTEQLAGDLLSKPSTDQLIATGFHRNTLINEEGGTDKEQFRVESVIDRVNTTGTVFLGLTIACAQCHKHKYDPISQRDYYNLYAIFNNCDEPMLQVPTAEQSERLRQIDAEIAAARKPLDAHDKATASAIGPWEQSLAASQGGKWEPLEPALIKTERGALLTNLGDKSLIVDFSVPANDVYTIEYDVPAGQLTAIRLETLAHASLPQMGPGRGDFGSFVLSEVRVRAKPLKDPAAQWKKVSIVSAVADLAERNSPASNVLDGNRGTGWSIPAKEGENGADHELLLFPKSPIKNAGGTRIELSLRHDHPVPNFLIGRFRVGASGDARETLAIPSSIRAIAAIPAGKRTAAQQEQLTALYRDLDAARTPLAGKVAALETRKIEIERAIATTLVMKESPKPRESFVMIRGDFLRPGARVAGGVPEFLPTLHQNADAPTRLEFSKWLFAPENPLTARVTVNRVWQHFFGVGLVDTENDFGLQGTTPTHPELLDWLSSELIRRGWSMKQLQRQIVESATYRQSSVLRDDLAERDPDNRLLARQSRLRLEAEIVRDAALAASGLLTSKLGGPSVYPPQPEGLYVVTQQKKTWPESQGPDRFRRGLYTYFWRSSPYPLLPTFDSPDANTSCTRRNTSNTPLQALNLANDRVFLEIAEGMARRILSRPADDVTLAGRAFELCVAREPAPQERDRLVAYVNAQRGDRSPAGEQAAWTAAARVLLNLDEFITRE